MNHRQPQGLRDLFRDPFLPRIYPEMRLCRDGIEREAAKKIAKLAWAQQIALGIIAVGLFIAFDRLVQIRNVLPSSIPYLLRVVIELATTIVLIWIPIYGGMYYLREPARRKIRAYLRTRGLLICENCGYDLRGLVDSLDDVGLCPECGEPTSTSPTPNGSTPAQSAATSLPPPR